MLPGMIRLLAALLLLAAAPALADPAEPPGLAPLSHTSSLAAVARIRSAARTDGGCTAVLIAPDLALTAGHCARGAVSGPRAMRLIFRPYDTPPAFQVTVRAVAFHEQNTAPGLDAANAHADVALLRLAMPVPAEVAAPLPLGSEPQPADASVYGYVNGDDDQLRGHPICRVESARPQLLVSDCTVVSGFSGAPLLSGGPGTWRIEGITVATVFGQPFRALIADMVPWPGFAGPYGLDAPPSTDPQTAP
jgi:protease YdgD